LNYPEYELIFGVHDAADPAVAIIDRLRKEFPNRRIELVICPRELGTNRKISNLIQMLHSVRYDYLLVNDGDIRVSSDYLQPIVMPLADSEVGLVTALYRATATDALGSQLEALSITDFITGVLVLSQSTRDFRFAFGSTLAFSRRTLERIGGFEALANYLADDAELAKLIAQSGRSVVIAEPVVETVLPNYSFRDFWNHQLRWARTVRDASPWGNLGLIFSFGVQWAAVTVIAARGAPWAWAVLGLAYASRIASHLATARVCKDSDALRRLWLLPLRDLHTVAVWIASYAGRSITWRGDRFIVKNGRLLPPEAEP
jgi:ceramide glucosyltransferase